jgi:hypothetical protein
MFGLKDDEILTCLLLIVVGYTIAKMFSRSCDGFSVGNQSLPLCPIDSHKPTRNPVDSCIAHDTDCENLYTHTIGSESPYAVHTCKKGGFMNAYRCISSGNECVFPDGHICTENADCNSGVCINSTTILGKSIQKCGTTTPPPPPPPSCPPGQSYCQSGDGTGNKGCYPECKKGNMRGADCLCSPECCFYDPDKCPGGSGVCDSPPSSS